VEQDICTQEDAETLDGGLTYSCPAQFTLKSESVDTGKKDEEGNIIYRFDYWCECCNPETEDRGGIVTGTTKGDSFTCPAGLKPWAQVYLNNDGQLSNPIDPLSVGEKVLFTWFTKGGIQVIGKRSDEWGLRTYFKTFQVGRYPYRLPIDCTSGGSRNKNSQEDCDEFQVELAQYFTLECTRQFEVIEGKKMEHRTDLLVTCNGLLPDEEELYIETDLRFCTGAGEVGGYPILVLTTTDGLGGGGAGDGD
jgi:hypothetical protein